MSDWSIPAQRQKVSDAEARHAFAELVKQYQGAALGYAYSILRNYAGAEDATQAAFLTAWVHRNDLREPQAFGGWLRTIVRTECIRMTRRAHIATVPLEGAFDSSPEPFADVGDWETRQLLLTAIDALPDSDRALIALRYMSDFSYQAICDFLGLPLSTVKKRLHGARRRLRTWLMASTSELRAQRLLRKPPRATHPRLKDRIMQLTDFLESVMRGDVAAVAAALDAHPEWLDATGENQQMWHGGLNALAVAAASGQARVAQLLLARGAHLKTPRTAAVSPIAIAAVEGHRHVVDVLVNGGMVIDLYAAASIGDAQRVAAFIHDNHALLTARTYDGKTALHFCASVEAAEVLVTAGAEIDPMDDAGQTPLEWMSNTGRNKAVCRYLIERGARADASDIFWACSHGNIPAVLQFLDADSTLVHARRPVGPRTHSSWVGRTPLHEAAIRGEVEVGRLLIERGADVNARVGENVTPLHLAAGGGHRDVAELLLAANADSTIRDASYDATPGEWAKFWGHLDLAAYLESHRA